MLGDEDLEFVLLREALSLKRFLSASVDGTSQPASEFTQEAADEC